MPNGDCRSALGAALASSTAHGISHGAATHRTPLKVMWALLFVVFLGLFFNSSSHLVEKLWNRTLAKTLELARVPFVFPDLYFCPSTPYSGSYPYSLTRDEADLVNSEISRLINRCYNMTICERGSPTERSAFLKAMQIVQSLPVSMSMKYLLQQERQSALFAIVQSPIESEIPSIVRMEAFSHPVYKICFKPVITEEIRNKLKCQDSSLKVWLSTDPYFTDFTYSGFPIMDLETGRGQSMKWFKWHAMVTTGLPQVSGYSMLVVSPGVYPTEAGEHTVHIAPGNAYHVRISVEENTFSDALMGTQCAPNHPKVAVKDHQTGEKVEFNYSYGYCYFSQLGKFSVNSTGIQMLPLPVPWRLRNIPRRQNLTEMTIALYDKVAEKVGEFWSELPDAETQISRYCAKRKPCTYLDYASSLSFEKWPSVGSAAEGIVDMVENLGQLTPKTAPALMKLRDIAKLAMADNHSAHVESVFRSYVSESLLSLRISSTSSMASLVTTDWSYSVTSFLADTGGVLGLYIGCSLLTLFEVIEMLWAIGGFFCCRSREQPSENGEGETEAAL